jgi:hypothetical protein
MNFRNNDEFSKLMNFRFNVMKKTQRRRTGGKFVVADQKIAGSLHLHSKQQSSLHLQQSSLHLHSKQNRKLARSCFS